jgi:hypothetical protein
MPIDWKVFHKNRAEFPLDKLDPYLGEWVAWSFTGDAIVAHSSVSEADLREKLRAGGADPNEYATSYIPGPGDVFDGAFILSRGKESANGAGSHTRPDPTSTIA